MGPTGRVDSDGTPGSRRRARSSDGSEPESSTYPSEAFSALFEVAPFHVHLEGADSRYLRVSRFQARQFGLTHPDQAVGRRASDYVDSIYASAAEDDERRARDSGRPVVGKVGRADLTSGGGLDRWAHATRVPLYGPDSSCLGVVGVEFDIAELVRSERRVRALRQRLAALFELADRLQRAESVEDLFRQAVEDGRASLGFDRFGIWLAAEEPNTIRGMFGTDEDGRTRDERDLRTPVTSWMLSSALLSGRTNIMVSRDGPLLSHKMVPVGVGDRACAAIRADGETCGSSVSTPAA